MRHRQHNTGSVSAAVHPSAPATSAGSGASTAPSGLCDTVNTSSPFSRFPFRHTVTEAADSPSRLGFGGSAVDGRSRQPQVVGPRLSGRGSAEDPGRMTDEVYVIIGASLA